MNATDILSGGNALLRKQFGETAQGDHIILNAKGSPVRIACAALIGRHAIRSEATGRLNLHETANIPVSIDKKANPQLVAILDGNDGFAGVPDDWSVTWKGVTYGIGSSEVDASGYTLELESPQ